MGLGALLIKERLGLSDREATLQIMENLYLQYFLGFDSYVDKEPSKANLEGKRRYGLGLIREKGAATSLTVIALQFMVMNLERVLWALFFHFFNCILCRPLVGS